MKRMIACVSGVSPASYRGTTNHRRNQRQIAVGKASLDFCSRTLLWRHY